MVTTTNNIIIIIIVVTVTIILILTQHMTIKIHLTPPLATPITIPAKFTTTTTTTDAIRHPSVAMAI